jgi:thioredoxin reductase
MTSFSRRLFMIKSSLAGIAFLNRQLIQFPGFNTNFMNHSNKYEVIIIGGSYAGLSAAMTLGRALRKVLILDAGKPCNRQTPYSHNFLTQDGVPPNEIAEKGREQLKIYSTVEFQNDAVEKAIQLEKGFQLHTSSGKIFFAEKLVFATGILDQLPNVKGFQDCWGKSILHCPYCHGYEVRNRKTGILANGDTGFDYVSLISNWTKQQTVFTNGKAIFTKEQRATFEKHAISVNESGLGRIDHENGQIKRLLLSDGSTCEMDALYFRPPFVQSCPIPTLLGCELTSDGYLKIDLTLQTTINGIYACGDNSSPNRTVSNAVASGHKVGMSINKALVQAAF